jgi:hypothetical protein
MSFAWARCGGLNDASSTQVTGVTAGESLASIGMKCKSDDDCMKFVKIDLNGLDIVVEMASVRTMSRYFSILSQGNDRRTTC